MVCFLCLCVVGRSVRWCRGCSGFSVFCLYWDACSLRCSLSGSTDVSSCRCCMFVSCVQPVAVLSAVFCIVCSLFMFVFDVMGDQTVLLYSRMGRVIVLYVCISVSFVLPQCVDVRALIILSVCLAFCAVFCMCDEYVSLGSKVTPRIFGFRVVGSMVSCICSERVVLYSAGSGVNSVVIVLEAFSVSWFSCVQLCIWCR